MPKARKPVTNHTGGPWEWVEELAEVCRNRFLDDDPTSQVAMLTRPDGGVITDPAEFTDEQRANGQLLAAAPSLLAALVQILDDWHTIGINEQVPDEINDGEHWTAVRDAIEAATGHRMDDHRD